MQDWISDPWGAPLAIALAGAIGGGVKTFVSGSGDVELSSTTTLAKGVKIWRPGWFANPGVGAIAALVSWALYGSQAGKLVFASSPNDLTWSGWGAAVLVGIGGSGWLSAEVDKSVFKKTAVIAAQKNSSPSLAATISAATPDQALKAAIDAD